MQAGKTPGADPQADAVRWTHPLLLFAVIALTFVALCTATVALPHNPYIRFQQLAKTIQFRSQWVYERIELDPAPINVAIIGNSRLGAGVSGPQLQSALRRITGRPIAAVNLSMPQEGRNIHYTIVKRLLEKRPEVKLIVLSAIEQMPREGHPAFRDLADPADVIRAPVLLNLDYPNDIAVLPFRQMSLFVQSLAPGLFHDRTTLDRAHYLGTDADSTQTFTLPDGHVVDFDSIHDQAELARAAEARIRGVRPPVLPAAQADYEFAVERYYTRRIVAVARARGVKVMFLALPIYTDRQPIRAEEFYRPFGPVLRPTVLDQDYRLFQDYAHLNVHGSRLVSAWLAEQIARMPIDWAPAPATRPGHPK